MYRSLVAFFLLFGLALGEPGERFEKGQTLPSFSALDQHGERLESAQLLGPQGALIIVFRSADW